jgi:hypothetical protein
MKTADLFKINRSSRRLNESIHRAFGKKINFESFNLEQLQDARNKIRTQLSQTRSDAKFNENLENDAYHQAQWMLDAINAEIAEREEYIIDASELAEDEVTNESTEENEMTKINESEINQASTIVTAKTMVDRVGRWIEELSGMENDTLLQLGDSIRDEIGQAEAKQFISSVAPAIQQALDNLKSTRETLSNAVNGLAGGEDANMLGAEDPVGDDMDMAAPADPDAMNAGDDSLDDLDAGADDEFGAADAAAGGAEAAGREQRESINFENRIYKLLAG